MKSLRLTSLFGLALLAGLLSSCDDEVLQPVSDEVETLDLSRYIASEGGKTGKAPGILGFASWNGHLFAPLQRLGSDWKPLDTSLVVEIDPASRKVVRSIALPLKNPYSMKRAGSKLYLACVGAWTDASYQNVLDGGVVEVDLSTGATKVLARESELGGNVSDMQMVGEKLYVVVSTSWPNSHVAVVKSGAVVDTLPGIDLAGGMQANGKNLFVAVRADKPFVAVVDPASDSIVGKMSTAIEPTEMDFLSSGKFAILATNYTVQLGALLVSDSAAKGAKPATQAGWSTSNLGMSVQGEVVYVLDRGRGTVTGFRGGDKDQVVFDWNAGSPANPYDVAVLGGEIWVACYDLSVVKIRKL